MKITLYGDPRTKKNSQQIITRPFPRVIPSKAYRLYETECLQQLALHKAPQIDYPVNVRCVYYMRTHRRVDLPNLEEATDDILVAAGYLVDDNSDIVAAHDGSYVDYDKDDPRVEITITPREVRQ